jgi:hypothetical protein
MSGDKGVMHLLGGYLCSARWPVFRCFPDELLRIPLLRGWVNRVASDALRAYDKPLTQHPVL